MKKMHAAKYLYLLFWLRVKPTNCSFSFVSDLDIGNVLLFPIDDKQSRLDGQDQVDSV